MSGTGEDYLNQAQKLFKRALRFKRMYFDLVEKAFNEIRPTIQAFEDKQKYSEAIEWLYRHVPDCGKRTLEVVRLIDAERRSL